MARFAAVLNDPQVHHDPGALEGVHGTLGRRWHVIDLPEELGAIAVLDAADMPSVFAQFEYPDGGGRVVCLADARLDNTNDLQRQLADLLPTSNPTAAELILAAYRRWNALAPRQLLGDFAFLIHDGRSRSSFGATDAFGVRSLYYRRDPWGRLMVASRSTLPEVARRQRYELNDEPVEAFLSGVDAPWASASGYRGVARLAGGTSVTCRDGLLSTDVYYRCGDARVDAPRERGAVLEEYRALLTRSLEARLSGRACALFVSGGVDSSSLFGLANHLIERGDVSVPFRGISSVFERTPRADERRYLAALRRRWPRAVIDTVLSDDAWLFDPPQAGFGPRAELEAVFIRSLMFVKLQRAAESGADVVLCGTFADQAFGAMSNTELLVGMGIPQCLREWPFFARPRTLAVAANAARRVGRMCLRRPPMEHVHGPHLAGFAWWRHLALVNGRSQHLLRTLEAFSDGVGCEWRFPFLDRRLVEFLLTIPPGFLHEGRVKKRLARESMRAYLPDEVYRRRDAGVATELLLRAIAAEQPRWLRWSADSRVVRLGWRDEARVRRALSECVKPMHTGAVDEGFRWAAVEAWLRTAEQPF